MSLDNKEFIIAELIRKQLILGELSVEENIELQQWLYEGENEKQYQKIIVLENLRIKEEFYTSIDIASAFSRVQNKIAVSKIHDRTINWKRRLDYAALVLVFFGLVGMFYFVSQPKKQAATEEVVTTISPKYNEPTLTLEDGTVVPLSQSKEQIKSQSGMISNVNHVLVYDAKELKGKSTGENTLNVPVGGIYAVTLSDGTKVWINSKSSLKYPVEFIGKQRIVTLEGEAYFEVTKNPNSPFMVKTKSGNVVVLGTHFNISSYDDDITFTTTLVEGKVKVSDINNSTKSKTVILKPGEQARTDKTFSAVKILTVDPFVYTAWKDGKFYFENESLKEILNRMARWYNFNVSFENQSLEKIKFTGLVLKDEPIDVLLKIISKTSNINYKITKKKSRV